MFDCKPEEMNEAEMLDLWDTWDTIEAIEAEKFEDSKEFDRCVFCKGIFPAEELNNRGECPDHVGETLMSENEKENWKTYLDYRRKQF